MTEDIKSPQFPESIFEGTLSSWLKKEGEEIKQDEVLAEIETDKVVIEVTAPSDGVMDKILVPEGSTIKSSDIIGRYKKGERISIVPAKDEKQETKAKEPEKKVKAPIEKSESTGTKKEKGFRMGPAAKKLLNEEDVDLTDLKASSKKGVVTKQDILEAAEKKPEKVEKESSHTSENEDIENTKRVPMTRL